MQFRLRFPISVSFVLICLRCRVLRLRQPAKAIAPGLDITSPSVPNERVSDATCFGCTIHVRGHVMGDVTAFGGSIVVEDQGQV